MEKANIRPFLFKSTAFVVAEPMSIPANIKNPLPKKEK
jgi:hypothetical protein